MKAIRYSVILKRLAHLKILAWYIFLSIIFKGKLINSDLPNSALGFHMHMEGLLQTRGGKKGMSELLREGDVETGKRNFSKRQT